MSNQIDAAELRGAIADEMQRIREAGEDHPYGSWSGGGKSSGGRPGGGGGGSRTDAQKRGDEAIAKATQMGAPKEVADGIQVSNAFGASTTFGKGTPEYKAFKAKQGQNAATLRSNAAAAKMKASSDAARKSADWSGKGVPRADMTKQLASRDVDGIRSKMGNMKPGQKVEVTYFDKVSIKGGPIATRHTVKGTVERVDTKFPSNPLVTGMAINSGKLGFYADVSGTISVKSPK